MNQIPSDILVAARQAYSRYVKTPHFDDAIARGDHDEIGMLSAIACAIVAERERCAQMCESHAKANGGAELAGFAHQFAALIRRT